MNQIPFTIFIIFEHDI